MKHENEIELDDALGAWSNPELVPDRPLTLSEKVEQAVSDLHSYRKSDRLVKNPQCDYTRNHGIDWCRKQRKLLSEAYRGGATIADLAIAFGRSEKAIRMKLESLGFAIGDSDRDQHWQQASPTHSSVDTPGTLYREVSSSFGDLIQTQYG